MNTTFSFTSTHTDAHSNARTGVIHTPHGDIQTPAFVPVGTQCSVKSLTPQDLMDLDTHLFFVNTYHAYLRPGIAVIRQFGGLHAFMHWDRPIITDSGGFQVFSLGRVREGKMEDGKKGKLQETALAKISEDGVEFQSHWDGSKHIFTPEKSMEYQWTLGSDIHISFDDCTPYPVTHDTARASMERTHRWEERSLKKHLELQMTNYELQKRPYQALYGSIQGSVYEDLRKESAAYISALPFDGIAIGGVAVGETKAEIVSVLDWVMPLLPEHKPRHLLGVGEFDDIFALIEHGVDTFDCVQPTRLARVGVVFTRTQNANIKNQHESDELDVMKRYSIDVTKSLYAMDDQPIDPTCHCPTCAQYSRGYLHHLFHVRELSAYRLATIHNLYFMNQLVREIREAIGEDTLHIYKKRWNLS